MSDSKKGCIHSGCLCCYTACDFDNIILGCVGSHDCLCLRHACCFAIGVPSLGCGVVTKEDEICKVALVCCDWGIIKPTKLWAGVRQHCCCYSVGSIPFHEDYVKEPVCAAFYLECFPEFDCCSPPPECKAHQRLTSKEPLSPPEPVQSEKMQREEQEEPQE